MAEHMSYGAALAAIASIALVGDAIMISLGKERKGSDLHAAAAL
jgi:hypothetical protein